MYVPVKLAAGGGVSVQSVEIEIVLRPFEGQRHEVTHWDQYARPPGCAHCHARLL